MRMIGRGMMDMMGGGMIVPSPPVMMRMIRADQIAFSRVHLLSAHRRFQDRVTIARTTYANFEAH